MLVAPRTRLVRANNPSPMTGAGTNSYLSGDDALVAIDPGPDLADHVDALLAAVPHGARVVALLVTHAHRDHLPAAYRLRERTGAPIVGHPDLPGVDRALADGEDLSFGGERLVALASPGHADDHVCFWLPAERLLFAGDVVAGVGTVVLSDTPGALARYLATLERLLALGPSTILPGHGPPILDGPGALRGYLAHRQARDEQILAALEAGAATVEHLVERLYATTPPALHPMAVRNVRAHLERLAQLGRVVEDRGAWIRRATGEGRS